MGAKDALGRYGESVAARHLREAGMEVLDRNWRCQEGELDIVAREGSVLVVCEVKTRRGLGFGSPLESVTQEKARRLRRLAVRWLADHELRVRTIRIDAIGVLRERAGSVAVEHVRGAC